VSEASGRRPETTVVAAGRPEAVPGAPLAAPVVLSATYRAGGELAYGRTGNAGWHALEAAVGELEGGEAVAFASGMAAATALFESLPLGARVVAPESGYYEVRGFLAERAAAGRFELELVDVADTDAALAACRGASLIWLESPTNPLMKVADLPALVAGAHEAGALVVVDNTFATPLLQRPLDLGADAVVHSVTKFLSGHSDLLMGVAVTRLPELHAALVRARHLYGGVPGPLDAFLALRGLRTLAVRLDRAQANARTLAERLAAHPAVERVRYPGLPDDPGHERAKRQMRGFGAMLAFEVRGGAEAAEQVCETVQVIAHATSLGGVESLMERRARWPGEVEMGTPPALVRLSVGIEHVEDLWADLDAALRASAPPR
jgi:cystathionine gamma-synthase